MRLRERLRFDAPPERLWPWFADPDRVRLWNPKLESDTAPPLDALRQGMEFWVRYRMREGAEAVDTRAELTELEAPTRLTLRYSGGALGREGWVLESVRITAEPGGSQVERVLTFGLPDVPWWGRLLMSLIMRFGTPRGESDLQAVRRVMDEARAGDAGRP